MAKGSAIIGKIKGHAGNLVFRVRKGEQIIQTKPGPRGKDHLPTYNQAWNYMRFKWASLMSQVTLELTDHSFTRKYMRQSSTNKFIQANVQYFNPINKKTIDRFDLTTNAPLTFNGIQMSTGDMAPVEIKYGWNESGGDFVLTDHAQESQPRLYIVPLYAGEENKGKNYNWNEFLQEEQVYINAKKWLDNKGIQPGEMATIVFMTATKQLEEQSWMMDRVLWAGLEMIYVRIKLNTDGTTVVIEPSKTLMNMTINITDGGNDFGTEINIGDRVIVGACIIHSKEVYGGWQCDDTIMRMFDSKSRKFIDNYTWTQNAETLYTLYWSTQQMPILDPASLTEENQQELRTGRVIATVNEAGERIYMKKITEEVTIEGENLEVSEKTKKKNKSTTSPEE